MPRILGLVVVVVVAACATSPQVPGQDDFRAEWSTSAIGAAPTTAQAMRADQTAIVLQVHAIPEPVKLAAKRAAQVDLFLSASDWEIVVAHAVQGNPTDPERAALGPPRAFPGGAEMVVTAHPRVSVFALDGGTVLAARDATRDRARDLLARGSRPARLGLGARELHRTLVRHPPNTKVVAIASALVGLGGMDPRLLEHGTSRGGTVGLEWSVGVLSDDFLMTGRYHYRTSDDAANAQTDVEDAIARAAAGNPSAGRMMKDARFSRDGNDLFLAWKMMESIERELPRMTCPSGQSFDFKSDRCVPKP
jgi:hypothetical protein